MTITRRKAAQHRRTTTANINCRPPPGRTYLTIGQDLFSIQEYLDSQYNASLHSSTNSTSTSPLRSLYPAAAMVYTDIQTVKGLTSPVDYGSGVEYADGLLDSVFGDAEGNVGLQIGLWLNGTEGCRQVIRGELYHQVDALFRYLEACRAPQVFLRVGYEFDNPAFGYMSDPLVYRQAFRLLYETCLYQKWNCPAKVKFVWHSWGASSFPSDLLQFYPGNDVVDWIGVSIFQQFGNATQLQTVYNVLDHAKRRNKPVMVAESTPAFGGITTWEDWFAPLLTLIEQYDIQMWSYINCNWEAQPMWHSVGFGDTRISTNKEVMQQWRQDVLDPSSRFLGAGSLNKYCADTSSSSSVPVVEKLSHGHSKRRRRKSKSQHGRPQHDATTRLSLPHRHELLVLAFILFCFGLALWVIQRGKQRRRRVQHLYEGRLDDQEAPPPVQHYYGAVEASNGN